MQALTLPRPSAPQLARISATCVALLASAAAHAQLALSLPVNTIQADAIQAFSHDAVLSFTRLGIAVSPKGNAQSVAGQTYTYDLPVTSISLQLLGIAGGAASGSALELDYTDDNNVNQRLTLANFVINFNTQQVLADATPASGPTTRQVPIFNFVVQTPLGLKYQFPLSVVGHEVLSQLIATSQGQSLMINALNLPSFVAPVLASLDLGTITIDVKLAPRLPPVPAKPYVASGGASN